MKRKRVAVLFGGRSSEYDVSLETAAAFMAHIDRAAFEVVPVWVERGSGAWNIVPDGVPVERVGEWLETASRIRVVLSPGRFTRGLVMLGGRRPLRTVQIDAALPLLHGRNGEDGTVQGAFELAGIPVVGCGAECSALCMDKRLAHVVAGAAGVPAPRSVLVRKREFECAGAPDGAASVGFPCFVKPVRSGSSIGISLVERTSELEAALELAFERDDEALVEERVDGSEVGVAVLERREELVCGEPDEIELAGGFFDFHEKYSLETSSIHVPARIPAPDRERVQELARRVFRALGCRGFARVDFFRAADGRLLFNEANTIPGFTAHSRFPMMMAAAGWTFGRAVNEILAEGVRR